MSKLYLSALICALFAHTAAATPVRFTWTSTVDDITPAIAIPGVDFGEAVTVEVVVDNGGNSLASQTWLGSDIRLARLAIDTYTANFVDGFIPVGTQPVFETDASGELTSVLFVGTVPSPLNSDSLSGTEGVRLLNNSVQASNGGDAYFVDRFVGPDPDDLIGWDRTPEFVPEPTTALLLLGFAALGIPTRRSQ